MMGIFPENGACGARESRRGNCRTLEASDSAAVVPRAARPVFQSTPSSKCV